MATPLKPHALLLALCLALAPVTPVVAQSYTTPPKGSEARADILDAIRPHAAWNFGPPVEFVVGEMRVAEGVAFVTLRAQRPGGGQIDIFNTPVVERQQLDPYAGDGPTLEVLLQKSGRVWVAVHLGISSSEGWWYDPAFCPIWAPVLPDVCK